MPRRLIMDCDPGVDDCIALMAALASPEDFDLLGVTTVAGNVPLQVCASNAASMTALAGRRDVPVHAGCPRPLVVDPVFAEHIHGESGLGDAVPPPGGPIEDEHAVDFLIRTLRAAEPASITLVPTGPMTNLAVALVKAPEIAEAIAELVIMGGAREAGGNITASAEFNIYADPHAAQIVLNCGRPITLIGLDATLQIRCTPERMAAFEALGNEAGRLAHAMISHVNRVYGDIYGEAGAALHDPCTIGYLLAPALFETCEARVSVATGEGLTRGHTAVDVYGASENGAPIRWATGLDAPALFGVLLERLGRL